MRRIWTGPALVTAAVLAACGGDDGTTTQPDTDPATTVVEASPGPPTTGSTGEEDPGATTAGPAPSPGTASPDPGSGSAPTGDATSAATGERCVSPLGYSVTPPADWQTNRGDVVPPCSFFDPQPFTVPEATDARPAVIALYVDPVPFDQVAAERDVQTSREETTLAGVDAVRVEAVEDGSGLYPEGTRRTAWYVDLPEASADGDDRTLVANVVGRPEDERDFGDATAVLDRLMSSLRLEPVTASSR